MSPTVLLVPGWWVGPTPFEQLSKALIGAGLKVETTVLPSTGTTSPSNPTMKDDIASVRKHIESIIARGEDVLVVLHSAGGFIGGAACEGLTKKDQGTKSGIVGGVLLSGAVYPQGHLHEAPPFTIKKNGVCLCAEPEILLFGDLAESDQTKWTAELKSQPEKGWDDSIPFIPWPNLPSVYIICENDNALPTSLQEEFASLAGSKIERLQCGHMPMLAAPERVAEIIQAAAAA